jgi:hypothetical protein
VDSSGRILSYLGTPREATKDGYETLGTRRSAEGSAAMEPAFFIIAILGCGEGDAPCEQVQLLQPRYESRAACTEATDRALISAADAPYPVVVAQCVGAAEKSGQVLPVEIILPASGPAPAKANPLKPARRAG